MVVAGLVLAGIAAAIHVYIWLLESVLWTTPRARATFGTTAEQAEQTKALAFNQGFYNLFLAVVIVIGVVLLGAGLSDVGVALVFVGTGSMVAAGLVLVLSDPSKLRAALVQLTPPALAIVALLIGILTA